VVCINGSSGIGKTELALEFAYRYSQRYKMVLWIGGEARYLRQNILNLSMNLGLDISAEAEKERGRSRSFEEQEFDAFQRVKRELFRDVPYLLVIDNLENERDWWEGKDLHDFIPRNTGATNVIVTTRLPRVMNLEPMQLPQLSYIDAMILMKGKLKNDYPPDETEVLRKLDERLGRLSFGLWVVGSLLSELMIAPSTLFEAVERISLNENLFPHDANDDGFCRNNSFLIKVLVFSFALMDRAKGGHLTSKMIIAGSWLAPAPVSSTLLAATASKLPVKGSIHLFGESLKTAFLCGTHCFLAPNGRKAEVESALLLVKLGLARKANRHRQSKGWGPRQDRLQHGGPRRVRRPLLTALGQNCPGSYFQSFRVYLLYTNQTDSRFSCLCLSFEKSSGYFPEQTRIPTVYRPYRCDGKVTLSGFPWPCGASAR
jgi:hypothetical protein